MARCGAGAPQLAPRSGVSIVWQVPGRIEPAPDVRRSTAGSAWGDRAPTRRNRVEFLASRGETPGSSVKSAPAGAAWFIHERGAGTPLRLAHPHSCLARTLFAIARACPRAVLPRDRGGDLRSRRPAVLPGAAALGIEPPTVLQHSRRRRPARALAGGGAAKHHPDFSRSRFMHTSVGAVRRAPNSAGSQHSLLRPPPTAGLHIPARCARPSKPSMAPSCIRDLRILEPAAACSPMVAVEPGDTEATLSRAFQAT